MYVFNLFSPLAGDFFTPLIQMMENYQQSVFAQLYVEGLLFCSPLSVSTVPAGTGVFSIPPRAQKHLHCSCCFFPFTHSFLIYAVFSGNRFPLHTDIFNLRYLRFSHNFMPRVSCSSALECVDHAYWNRLFSTPPPPPPLA